MRTRCINTTTAATAPAAAAGTGQTCSAERKLALKNFPNRCENFFATSFTADPGPWPTSRHGLNTLKKSAV